MREVVVTVVGTQTDEHGEESRIELIATGNSQEKNGVQYITYRESEISGMEGTTTVLKVFADHFALIRMGAVEQKQEFFPGQKSYSTYITPLGAMKMGILTKRLELAVTCGTGFLSAAYELEIDGRWLSSNTLSVTIQEEK
ncbi:MAG: DUF1934 domain-containing protein [Negativicutes bacterium]|nr:DUF1934 domain-containing protein [Negativicutes bacterium]